MKLVLPTHQYKDSFIIAVHEHLLEQEDGRHHRNHHYQSLDMTMLNQNFDEYLKSEDLKSLGVNLEPGRVPETNYWCIVDEEYVGRISIRHHLTDPMKVIGHIGYDIRPSRRGRGHGNRMLSLALPRARDLGIDCVVIGCYVTNIASKRVIENNGGRFDRMLPGVDGAPSKLQYWIPLV